MRYGVTDPSYTGPNGEPAITQRIRLVLVPVELVSHAIRALNAGGNKENGYAAAASLAALLESAGLPGTGVVRSPENAPDSEADAAPVPPDPAHICAVDDEC